MSAHKSGHDIVGEEPVCGTYMRVGQTLQCKNCYHPRASRRGEVDEMEAQSNTSSERCREICPSFISGASRASKVIHQPVPYSPHINLT
jgi:hypothetical protein